MVTEVAMDSKSKGTKFSQVGDGERGAGDGVQEGIPDGIRVGAYPRQGRSQDRDGGGRRGGRGDFDHGIGRGVGSRHVIS